MATEPDNESCKPITFKLNIKNTVEPNLDTFTVNTISGQTLLWAMEAYRKYNSKFRFETQDVPTSGLYVVSVNGIKNGHETFWQTLLGNEQKDIKVITLYYQVRAGDNVFLKYGYI